ncbi:MAG: AraC family transcriptional regulator [Leptolyngbyaceae cyanobacterium MO_188.B28]|nr:AraC family transcriptional regulator [Leptolyngbyaceae cyanobacterium MO_188.B28]
MSPITPVTFDVTQANSNQQIFPRQPLLASQQTTWQDIYLGHHRQPPHETPNYTPLQYTVSIHLGYANDEEQWWGDGHFQRTHLVHGDVSLYPANCPQKQRWQEEIEFIDVCLEPRLLNQVAEQLGCSDRVEILPHQTVHDPLIQQLGLTLKAELEAAHAVDETTPLTSGSRLYADSIAHTLAIHLLRHYSVQKPVIPTYNGGLSRHKLKTAIAYIHDHLDQALSLAEIAAVVQISPHYFASLFKQSTGLTPHQYVTTQRIERAKQLLTQPEWAIADIAQQVGFQNQSYFTTVFRKHTGVTPKGYRGSRDRG